MPCFSDYLKTGFLQTWFKNECFFGSVNGVSQTKFSLIFCNSSGCGFPRSLWHHHWCEQTHDPFGESQGQLGASLLSWQKQDDWMRWMNNKVLECRSVFLFCIVLCHTYTLSLVSPVNNTEFNWINDMNVWSWEVRNNSSTQNGDDGSNSCCLHVHSEIKHFTQCFVSVTPLKCLLQPE